MSVGADLRTIERRQAVWQVLRVRRYDTAANLAREFHVSIRTMHGDLQDLMRSYPIEAVRGRYGGGYKLLDWYCPNRSTLSSEQITLLQEVEQRLCSKERQIIRSILDQFAP